jgi:hypothetical protein
MWVYGNTGASEDCSGDQEEHKKKKKPNFSFQGQLWTQSFGAKRGSVPASLSQRISALQTSRAGNGKV